MRSIAYVFGIFWVFIWIIAISAIVSAIKKQNKVKKFTNQARDYIFSSINNNVSNKDDDDEGSFTEPKKYGGNNEAPRTVYVNRSSQSKNSQRRSFRDSRVYGTRSEDKAAHGKLSQESRDDEKNWF